MRIFAATSFFEKETMQEVINKILTNAVSLFCKYGIKSVTMDDIAVELGISKKTLYQCFANKADLVQQTIEQIIRVDCLIVKTIQSSNRNAIDEMFAIAEHVYQQLNAVNLTTIYDLHKYYPQSWKILEEHRLKFIQITIFNNLKKGIEQGYYRTDLEPHLVALYYLAKAQALVNDHNFAKYHYTPVELFTELFKYHIYGIASEKGRIYLEANMAKINAFHHAKN